MSFSYGGDPSGGTVDAVRFLVGDTDETEAFLSDEEILYLDTLWGFKGSDYWTASMAADAVAAKLTREVTITADGQSLGVSELQEKYLNLANSLRSMHQTLLAGGTVSAGGVEASEQPDQTVRPLSFGIGMHDSIEAGQQQYGGVVYPPFDPLIGQG